MSTLTGKDLNLVKPALTDDHKVTIGTDLPANFQKIDDEFTAHLAETAPHNMAASKTASGYQKLPNGLIFQWRAIDANTLTSDGGGGLVIAFPVVFPNAVFSVYANMVAANYEDTNKIVGVILGATNHMQVVCQAPLYLFPRKIYIYAIGY